MRIQKMGWILTAAMAGAMAVGGFQPKTEKIGVVDVGSVFQNSDMTHTKQEELKAMQQSRFDVLQFVHTYRAITPVQADRFKILSLKVGITPAEKTELDKLKADVLEADKSLTALQTKPSPSQDDVVKMNAINAQKQQMALLEQRWAQEFDRDLRQKQDELRKAVLDKVQDSLKDVGKKQAYSLIFVRDVAPYGANDVTGDTLKVMNAKK
jgi:Skp family chaperone for outer membrane proteins